jgi:3-hydroxyacyl-CoA dehydrogenase/enoyl-CoA hydratase/3-hydroxybutyryl-CoA epimerase
MTEATKVERGPSLSTEQRGDVLVIWIDVPGEPVNTLGPSMVGEFEAVFAGIEQNAGLKGVVIASAKPSGFIAGADVEQFAAFKSPHDATQVSALGQDLLNRLE